MYPGRHLSRGCGQGVVWTWCVWAGGVDRGVYGYGVWPGIEIVDRGVYTPPRRPLTRILLECIIVGLTQTLISRHYSFDVIILLTSA